VLSGAGTSSVVGAASGSGLLCLVLPKGTSYMAGRAGSGTTATSAVGVTDRTGHSVVNRTGSAGVRFHRNGAFLDEIVNASSGVQTQVATILRSAAAYTSDQVFAFHQGAGLSDAKVDAIHDALAAYYAAVNA
jgi:hypothetical protein